MLKLALDIGPLVIFFVANARFGMLAATGSLMVAVLVAVIVSYLITRHVGVMPIVTVVVVLLFGGLTLYFDDQRFIQIKPTIIYCLFAVVLLGGLLFKKPLLGMVLDSVLSLTDEGWRKLTARWVWFFFALALLNEIVRHAFTFDFWVSFKLFGFLPLTLLFGALQYPLLMKYGVEKPGNE